MFETLPKNFKIIPQTRESSPQWAKRVFFASFAPLVILGLVYLYLLSQETKLETKKELLTAQVIALESNPQNQQAQKDFKELSLKINDFGAIFAQHQAPSKFFQLVRDFCHKNVQFTGLRVNVPNREAVFSGMADDFKALSEQLLILKNQENISNPKISGIKLEKDGKVAFDLSLNFAPEVLKSQNE